MGPKKQKHQKDRQEWNECRKCGVTVHKSNVGAHSENCSSTCSFVANEVFHAFAAPHTKEYLEQIPLTDQRDHIILIHTSVMKLCHLQTGLRPALGLVNGRHVLKCWPCDPMPANQVLLPPVIKDIILESAEESCLITVERFHPPNTQAGKVEIDLRLPAFKIQIKMFLRVLKCIMADLYIFKGMTHRVRYFGQEVTFTVKSIKGILPFPKTADQPSLGDPSSDVVEISERLSALEISGISTCGDTSISGADSPSLNRSGAIDSSVSSAGDSSLASISGVDDVCAKSKLHSPSKTLSERDGGDSVQSPCASTPVRPKPCWERPKQFCTPVQSIERKGPMTRHLCEPFFQVTERTEFVLPERTDKKQAEGKTVSFEMLGGLDKQIQRLKRCLSALRVPLHQGNETPLRIRHCLIHGLAGTGKTFLVRAAASESGAHTAWISPANFYQKEFGETEAKLQEAFDTAQKRAPSVIVVDKLDVLCPKRTPDASHLSMRVVRTFNRLLRSLPSTPGNGSVVVLATACQLHDIDPEVCRHFMKMETNVPSAEDRYQILQKLLKYKDVSHVLSDGDIKSVADGAHGYVGDDLLGIVNRAKDVCWRQTQEDPSPVVTVNDLKQAAKEIPASAMKEVQFVVPKVRWQDIGGQSEAKAELQRLVDMTLHQTQLLERFDLKPPKGILMYGPPGCSKTMMVKALACESGLNFFAVKGPELLSKYVGESERAVRELFRKARAASPSVVFFDEIDSLAVKRGMSGSNHAEHGVLTQLLTELDGVEELRRVIVVAATNRPDKVDQALLRPGRFSQLVYVPLPDACTRREILHITARRMPFAADVSLDQLVLKTQQFSGAELTQLCQNAAVCSLKELQMEAKEIHMRHFEAALKDMRPQTTSQMIAFYEDYLGQITCPE